MKKAFWQLNPWPFIGKRMGWLMVSLMLLLQSCTSSVDAIATDSAQLRLAQPYMVKPDILALRIEAGTVQYGRQIPYTRHWADVFLGHDDPENNWLKRGGQIIGALVGQNKNLLYTFDRYEGSHLDPDWADDPRHYRLDSPDDPRYWRDRQPKAIFRKTKPTDMARTGAWEFEWPLVHTLYLQLPTRLIPGKTYRLSLRGLRRSPLVFQYNPQQLRSEAVHISQIGFRPDDPAKMGFLSVWMGNGGGLAYDEGLTFWLINEQSQRPVYQGKTQLSKDRDEDESPHGGNFNRTDVYSMDFSNFQQPGHYRLCVADIGCSLAFEIGDQVWQEAFSVSARGFYHQRSGIALGPPFTSLQRPRPFHPDDGMTVYQSTVSLLETHNGLGDRDAFEALVEHRTDEIIPNAWGGYFDAGDWDRRIQHLEVARALLELYALFPHYFSTLSLNLPESENGIPDVVDEALWGVDFFQRLQTPEGGIRGGIESAAHPQFGETSWQESLLVMAYAPDLWSSYIYAGVAARAAYHLGPQTKRAAAYQESALQAIAYAEREYARLTEADLPHAVKDERNLAALELFRLTGDERWHRLFLETTVFADPNQEVFEWKHHQQRDAAFLYARLQAPTVDWEIQRNAHNALLREADMLQQFGNQTGFKWSKDNPWEPVGWGTSFGAPRAIALLRAYTLSGDAKYLAASVLASQFPAGANPDNLVYTTGLGDRSPQHPLVVDQRITGDPPPPGITVYGPLDLAWFEDNWNVDLFREVTFPAPEDWPTAEGYFDVYLFPAVTEFTVMQTMVPTAYTWGYLAARAPLSHAANQDSALHSAE